MKTNKIIKGLTIFASSAIFSMSTIQSAYAAPGVLADSPLFLTTLVQPNVFFTLDDSGSMEWETMIEGSAYNGLPSVNGRYRGYLHPSWWEQYKPGNGSGLNIDVLPPSEGTGVQMYDDTWIYRNHNGNGLYYNPATEYKPWAGTAADGSEMYPEDPGLGAHAWRDPNFTGTGDAWVHLDADLDFTDRWGTTYANVVDLSVYYIWDDTDGDGVIEPSDGHTPVDVTPTHAEWENFANWFVYYRSRMNATKSSIGAIINNTDRTRMGLDVFNRQHQKDAKTMVDNDNKRELLEDFYSTWDGNGTPARQSMKRVGEYFREDDGSGPILDDSDGGDCQHNFNIFMSDGFWNGNTPSGIDHRDRDGGSGGNNSPYDGDASESNDGGNYADNHRDTLADVAMKYYEDDLRTDVNNNVPTRPGVDENPEQHLVTYTIAFGVKGRRDPLTQDPTDAGFTWPDPDDGDEEKVDDMWHAAYNGRGEFLSAQSAAQLEDALGATIKDIADRTSSAAAVAINSAKLTTDAVVFLAEFNPNRWQGDLIAKKIADTDTGELEIGHQWRAAEKLNARSPVSRTMITFDGSDGIPFQWDVTVLPAFIESDLNMGPTGVADGNGAQRLAYMRGDRSLEGTYRERITVLGDLVHSGPVYVGKPELNWPDKAPFPSTSTQRYSDFKNDNENREPVVYIGANDGMLHGFSGLPRDAFGAEQGGGEELIAYIPGNLYSTGASAGLHYLTEPNYLHEYYVDLSPTVSDVYANLGGGIDEWQTILIGGQRGGGRGIFALNVNDPGTFNEANAADIVLWEFTSEDDDDLGYTFSRPEIAMANNGQFVAILGNGYNDTGDGEAKLFILDIERGVDGTWTPGSDYREIPVPTYTDPNDLTRVFTNGLSTPRLVDSNGDGTVDRVYAGDLFGRLWAFDMLDPDPTNWGIADVSNRPLFTTINNAPITSRPAVARHPTVSSDGSNDPNLMVYFGSGQYLVSGDNPPFNRDNYFYGVWDRGSYGLTGTTLVEQTYRNGFQDENGNDVRVLTRNLVDYSSGGDDGWKVSLEDPYERLVEPPVVRGDVVFFNTFIPTTDPCALGTSGWGMALDLITGGSPDTPTTDVNGDGIIDDDDRATNGGQTAVVAGVSKDGYLPEPVFIEDISYTGQEPTKVIKLQDLPTGRFSWQELLK